MTTDATDPANVVPEAELARRRRVKEICADVADLFDDALDRISELIELEPDHVVALSLLGDEIGSERVAKTQALGSVIAKGVAAKASSGQLSLDQVGHVIGTLGDSLSGAVSAMFGNVLGNLVRDKPVSVMPDEGSPDPFRGMRRVLDRLFAEAPKLEHADGTPDLSQAPALECHVALRGVPAPMFGVLSKTPEGTLRMLSPADVTDPDTKRTKRVFCEQFFDIADVVSIMVERPVTGETGRIIT